MKSVSVILSPTEKLSRIENPSGNDVAVNVVPVILHFAPRELSKSFGGNNSDGFRSLD